MLRPARYDFTIFQGATFDRTITWRDGNGQEVNLTGYTARLQVRDRVGGEVLLDLSTGDGITLGGPAGTIALAISAVDTAALRFSQAVYDLELTSAGDEVTRLMQGKVLLSPEVTS